MEKIEKYYILDTETTGLREWEEQVIELAFREVINGKAGRAFNYLLKVEEGKRLEPKIISLTGITDDLLEKDGKNRKAVLERAENILKGEVVVAYNAPFDLKFLNAEFVREFGKPFVTDYIDALEIARDVFKDIPIPNKKLETIADFYGFKETQDHRALSDVDMTHFVLENLKKEVELENYLRRFVGEVQTNNFLD